MSHALQHPTRDRTALVGAMTATVAVGLPVAAILTADLRDVDVQPGLIDWVFVGGVAVLALATFGALTAWLRRRPAARTGGAGLALAVVALLATPVTFWTMVPVIFGTAGAWLGYRAAVERRRQGRGAAVAATATGLGALAALASVVMYVATS